MSSTRSSRRSRGATEDDGEDGTSDLATASHYLNARAGMKRKLESSITVHNNPKKRRRREGQEVNFTKEGGGGGWSDLQDVYCWECHKECVEGALDCAKCPRTFHPLCLPKGFASEASEEWECLVCRRLAEAESVEGRSEAMRKVDDEGLALMLAFALKRMRHPDAQPFERPVPASLVPEYYDRIFHPLDLSTIERRVKEHAYSSTWAFLEDAKWILHNCIIFNGTSTKFCADAKLIIKIAAHEMAEIQLCPDCYRASVLRRDNWFCEPCAEPHCLVWARLKGFPYWPAKALRVSLDRRLVDVRFFGQHDRAWLPLTACALLSPDPPAATAKNARKHGWETTLDELVEHKKRLTKLCPDFALAPNKVELRPEHLEGPCPLFAGKEALAELTASEDADAASEVGSSVSGSQAVGKEEDLLDSSAAEPKDGAKDSKDSSKASEEDLGVLERLSRSITKADAEAALETVGKSEEKAADGESKEGPSTEMTKEPTEPPAEKDSDKADGEELAPETMDISLPLGQDKEEEDEEDEEQDELTKATEKKPVKEAEKAPSASVPKPVSATSSFISSLFSRKASESKPAPAAVPADPAAPAASPAQSRKRNLDFLVDRMREGAGKTPPPPDKASSSTSSSAQAKKSSVVITHEKMLAKPTGQAPRPAPSESSWTSGQMERVFQRHAEKISSALTTSLKDMWTEALAMGAQGSSGASNGDSAGDEATAWAHKAVVASLRAEMVAMRAELSARAERERSGLAEEARRRLEEEKARAVAETKRKQWCAACAKEAVFYCCWNTSYCDYPCQQAHWPKHQMTCAQIRGGASSSSGAAPNGSAAANGALGHAGPQQPFRHALPKPPAHPQPHPQQGPRLPHQAYQAGFLRR